MTRFALLFVVLSPLAARAEAPRIEPLRLEVAIHTIDGWFNTYSVPGKGSWTFDMSPLLAEKEHGKIEFTRSGEDRTWYFPYHGKFRVEKQATDADGWNMLRLVNESHGHRTTISLSRHGPKEQSEWRGFFVFEQSDGPILGMFSFKNVK
jgi:hypothetical protein